MTKKLYKSKTDIKFDGVCSGVAKYFGWDVALVRILWVVISFFTGVWTGLVAYVICAIIMPREPDDDFIDYRDDRQN